MLGSSVGYFVHLISLWGREVDYKSWMLPLGRTALC